MSLARSTAKLKSWPFAPIVSSPLKTMCMYVVEDEESISVRNAGFVVRNPACWRSTSARTQTSDLTSASPVISPLRLKVNFLACMHRIHHNNFDIFMKLRQHFTYPTPTCDFALHFFSTYTTANSLQFLNNYCRKPHQTHEVQSSYEEVSGARGILHINRQCGWHRWAKYRLCIGCNL